MKPEYNIRTDKWEIAAEANDKVVESKLAARTKDEGKIVDLNPGGKDKYNENKAKREAIEKPKSGDPSQ